MRVVQIEIRTRSIDAAARFYQAAFDWRIHRLAPDYAIIDTGKPPIASLLQTPDPAWPLGLCPYALTDDCLAAGEQAVSLGGRIAITYTELPGSGAYVDTLDPWGNELAFWQREEPVEPQLSGPGTSPFCYAEVPVADLADGISYYRQLCGWKFHLVPGLPAAFTEEVGLGRGVGLVSGSAARLRGITCYVQVPDCQAAAERVRAAGGQVILGPTDNPEGRYLLLRDPEGNRLGAFHPAES